MKNVEVLKFGGSSFGPDNQIEKGFENNIWPFILEKIQQGKKLIIVVSAPQGMTRKLREESLDAGNRSKSPEMDEYLSRGEKISTGFLEYRIHKEHIHNKKINVADIPLITDDAYGEAEILFTDVDRIHELVSENDVIIVPGFIGKTIFNNTTTLGFNGSDTSAIYFAKAIEAPCILFKDVAGLFTADPRKVEKSKLLKEANTLDCLLLAMLGCSVIHAKGLSIAHEFGIDIRLRSNFLKDSGGTLISNKVPRAGIAGVTDKKLSDGRVVVSVVGIGVKEGMLSQKLPKHYGAEQFSTGLKTVDSVILGSDYNLSKVLSDAHSIYGLDSDDVSQNNFIGQGK